MTTATLLRKPVARTFGDVTLGWCGACFGVIEGPSDTGLYCVSCACPRCGESATGSDGRDGFCGHCTATLEGTGYFG